MFRPSRASLVYIVPIVISLLVAYPCYAGDYDDASAVVTVSPVDVAGGGCVQQDPLARLQRAFKRAAGGNWSASKSAGRFQKHFFFSTQLYPDARENGWVYVTHSNPSRKN